MKNISIIVAVARNHAIGKDNKLLWHLSEDLKRFKKLTTGHYIVMGKKTYYSLPNRPLPNRTHLVLTDVPGELIDNCTMAYSVTDALEKMHPEEENFIIGGASIYKQFLRHANKLYITWVHEDFEADTFFPHINDEEWDVVSKEDFLNPDENNPYPYSYIIYERKK
ncbi:MAG: dihydrofolate reductase [Bacteroidales bacterium]|nr:dihydrofolate reductase [Bacteroidales bacterium]MCF8404777.1 dihydrofolate reductase [Bacteroidales bacterium]